MRNVLASLALGIASISLAGFAGRAESAVKRGYVTIDRAQIHYGVFESDQLSAAEEAKGDVLYIHGFGDRFDNHQALFESFNNAGFRVLAFDLPSHGESFGGDSAGLNRQTFDNLVDIAARVVATHSSGPNPRPFILSGWSLGGLIAARIAQEEAYRAKFPKIAGLILYAPSVAPKACVGSLICAVVNSTLTHDELLFDREIKPKFPLSFLSFDARLLIAAAKTWRTPLPSDLSTLVFVADPSDRYVSSVKIVDWVKLQRATFITRVPAYGCRGARHELDNETAEYGGPAVRELSARFAEHMANGEIWDSAANQPAAPCFAF